MGQQQVPYGVFAGRMDGQQLHVGSLMSGAPPYNFTGMPGAPAGMPFMQQQNGAFTGVGGAMGQQQVPYDVLGNPMDWLSSLTGQEKQQSTVNGYDSHCIDQILRPTLVSVGIAHGGDHLSTRADGHCLFYSLQGVFLISSPPSIA
jgi:hypothetical protein